MITEHINSARRNRANNSFTVYLQPVEPKSTESQEPSNAHQRHDNTMDQQLTLTHSGVDSVVDWSGLLTMLRAEKERVAIFQEMNPLERFLSCDAKESCTVLPMNLPSNVYSERYGISCSQCRDTWYYKWVKWRAFEVDMNSKQAWIIQ